MISIYFHKVQIPRQTIKKRYNYLSDIYITELRKRNRRLRKPSVPNRAVTVYKKYFSQKKSDTTDAITLIGNQISARSGGSHLVAMHSHVLLCRRTFHTHSIGHKHVESRLALRAHSLECGIVHLHHHALFAFVGARHLVGYRLCGSHAHIYEQHAAKSGVGGGGVGKIGWQSAVLNEISVCAESVHAVDGPIAYVGEVDAASALYWRSERSKNGSS